MKKIYIAGPYRANSKAGIRQNVKRARKAAQILWLEGWAVFCPHMNSAYLEGPDQIFLDGDIEWLKCSDAIFMLENWASSRGALAEHTFAQNHKLEIYYQNRSE